MALTEKSKKSTIIKQWVAALRSGEYKQGTNCLKMTVAGEAQYCCLGVLSDLAVKAKVIKKLDGSDAYLSEKVVKWAGLKSKDGAFNKGLKSSSSLADENDVKEKSFKQIARIIERQPKGLFSLRHVLRAVDRTEG